MKTLVDYFKINYGNDVDRINFEAPIQTTKELGKEYEKILLDIFDVLPMSWKWFYKRVDSFSEKQIEMVSQAVQELKNDSKVSFLSPIDDLQLKEVLSNQYMIKNWKCSFILESVTILANGDVTYCTDFPDLKFGNIYQETVSTIFENALSEKFRNSLTKNLFPICSRCPRIYQKDEFIMEDRKTW